MYGASCACMVLRDSTRSTWLQNDGIDQAEKKNRNQKNWCQQFMLRGNSKRIQRHTKNTLLQSYRQSGASSAKYKARGKWNIPAFCAIFSSLSTSSAAMPILQARGLPPNVLPCSPGLMVRIISCDERTAETGYCAFLKKQWEYLTLEMSIGNPIEKYIEHALSKRTLAILPSIQVCVRAVIFCWTTRLVTTGMRRLLKTCLHICGE